MLQRIHSCSPHLTNRLPHAPTCFVHLHYCSPQTHKDLASAGPACSLWSQHPSACHVQQFCRVLYPTTGGCCSHVVLLSRVLVVVASAKRVLRSTPTYSRGCLAVAQEAWAALPVYLSSSDSSSGCAAPTCMSRCASASGKQLRGCPEQCKYPSEVSQANGKQEQSKWTYHLVSCAYCYSCSVLSARNGLFCGDMHASSCDVPSLYWMHYHLSLSGHALAYLRDMAKACRKKVYV